MKLMAGNSSVQEVVGHSPAENDQWHGPVGVQLEAKELRKRVVFQTALLSRTIEHQVIPRLIEAHPSAASQSHSRISPAERVSADQLREFSKMLIATDFEAAQKRVQLFQDGDSGLASVYLDFLAPAARDLGTMWEEDLCDFTDVTIGLGRLQQLLRELSPDFHHAIAQAYGGKRILLLPSPGETHIFGLAMIAEIFRNAGWDVSGGPGMVADLSVVLAASEWFDVVGYSLGSDAHVDELRDAISKTREAALNPHVGIMVGGPVFAQHPELGDRVGADVVTSDGRMASELAIKLVADRGRTCT